MVQYRRFQPRQIISGHEIIRLSNYIDSLDQRSPPTNTTVADGPGDGPPGVSHSQTSLSGSEFLGSNAGMP